MKNERGLTLVEQVLTLLIISLTVLAWLNIFRVSAKGINNSKFSLRAQSIAQTKMEEFRSTVDTLGMAGAWAHVTKNARIVAFATPQVHIMNTQAQSTSASANAYTYVMSYGFVQPTLGGAPVAAPAGTVTELLSVTVTVSYRDLHGPRKVTAGAYISSPRN